MADSTLCLRHYIDGEWREPVTDGWITDVNPSDEADVIASVPIGSPEDTSRAALAAEAAMAGWQAFSGPERAEYLYRWAEAIKARSHELANMMAREVGKPVGEARGEVERCVTILRYYAGEAVRSMGQVIPAQAGNSLQFTLRQPVGPVALITPWNFPLAIPLWKAAPALAFGNTVVLKPAEAASRLAVLLAELAGEAGLPPGVFNVLLGSGRVVGAALVDHAAIRALSFTGSGAVGEQLAVKAAARNLKYQMEMGGKNVAIVLADADLDQAAALVAAGAMRYAGQKCTATSRVVVSQDVWDPFRSKLLEAIAALKMGPVESPDTAVGPLISRESRERVEAQVADCGGEVLFGGRRPSDASFARGYFFQPTVITGISPNSPLAQEEIFGPVIVLLPAKNLDEALSIANGTRYGLSAALFTRDVNRALEYIRRIDVGMVRVNGDTSGVDPHAPFGGMRASSSHSREQGPAAVEFFTETKTVQISPAGGR